MPRLAVVVPFTRTEDVGDSLIGNKDELSAGNVVAYAENVLRGMLAVLATNSAFAQHTVRLS